MHELGEVFADSLFLCACPTSTVGRASVVLKNVQEGHAAFFSQIQLVVSSY